MIATKEKRNRIIAGIVIGVGLIALPFYAADYTITTFIRIIYFGFLASSVGMLIGQGGMISLTQTAFFGLSGYVVGLLGHERGFSFPFAILLALFAVIVLSFIFGLLAMRTHRIVFLMLTLALGQICWAFARQNTSLLHGWRGILGIEAPVIFGIDFSNQSYYYWASLILFAAALFILWKIVHSPFGLSLNGTRESPRRMSAIGYSVYWTRLIAFIIAALYAGVGGLLATYYNGNITPTTIQLSRTIWVVLVVVLGGAYYFWGPLLGTIIGVWLEVLISQATPRYNTIIGLIFVATVLLAPNGILGLLDKSRIGKKVRSVFGLYEKTPQEITDKGGE